MSNFVSKDIGGKTWYNIANYEDELTLRTAGEDLKRQFGIEAYQMGRPEWGPRGSVEDREAKGLKGLWVYKESLSDDDARGLIVKLWGYQSGEAARMARMKDEDGFTWKSILQLDIRKRDKFALACILFEDLYDGSRDHSAVDGLYGRLNSGEGQLINEPAEVMEDGPFRLEKLQLEAIKMLEEDPAYRDKMFDLYRTEVIPIIDGLRLVRSQN